MPKLTFEIVDVFTDKAYTGNPLAVVFGGEDLDTGQMQAVAREFNLSETLFVLPATTAEASYRARIFTPGRELPFAGHPTVGAAVTLVRRGDVPEGKVVQECGAGLLPITVDGGRATVTGAKPSELVELEPGPYLEAAGLTADDLAGIPHRTGCGIDHNYLPVKPEAVARAVSRDVDGVEYVYLFAWDAAEATAHARLFAPKLGVGEDPATGSAALGLGSYLVGTGVLPGDGLSRYRVLQGAEIQRPSVMDCEVAALSGGALSVTVAGGAEPVARGELVALPGA